MTWNLASFFSLCRISNITKKNILVAQNFNLVSIFVESSTLATAEENRIAVRRMREEESRSNVWRETRKATQATSLSHSVSLDLRDLEAAVAPEVLQSFRRLKVDFRDNDTYPETESKYHVRVSTVQGGK